MDTMEVDSAMDSAVPELPQPHPPAPQPDSSKILDQGIPKSTCLTLPLQLGVISLTSYRTATMQPRESFREIAVKVHIRRPEKDSWVYLGRALVSQEMVGQASRVGTCCDWFHNERLLTSIAPTVVRAVQSQKIIAIFGEVSHCNFYICSSFL